MGVVLVLVLVLLLATGGKTKSTPSPFDFKWNGLGLEFDKNHTCKEWKDKVNQKGYLTKHQKSKTRLISIVSKPIKAVFVLLLDVC